MTNIDENKTNIELAWDSAWWHKPVCRKNISITRDALNDHIKYLRTFFDQTWFDSFESASEHPIAINLMCGEGLPNIQTLLTTAIQLRSLENVHGFSRVRDAYINPDTWESAQIEMLIGHTFNQPPFSAEFIVPKAKKGPTPDILVHSDNATFTIECKRLQDGPGESWMEALQYKFLEKLDCETPKNLHCLLLMNSPFIDLKKVNFKGKFRDIHDFLIEYLEPAIQQLRNLRRRNKYNSLSSIGNFHVALLTDKFRESASIQLPEPSSYSLIRRLTPNLDKAAAQINAYYEKTGTPGFIVAWQAEPADYQELHDWVTDWLKTNNHNNVLGVLITRMGNILTYQAPLWVANRDTCFTDFLAAAEDQILKSFCPVTLKS